MSRTVALRAAAQDACTAQFWAAEKRRNGDLAYTADDPDCPDVLRLAALGEEFGEVCRCLHDNNPFDLRDELAQLAGIALAWIVALDR